MPRSRSAPPDRLPASGVDDGSSTIVSRGAPPPCLDRLLTGPEVRALVRLSRSTVWRYERAGKFPPRIPSSNRALWRESEIAAWIAGTWTPRENSS